MLHIKKDAFPGLCHKELLSDGEHDFTLVFVSLDLLLPLIFPLSLNLHLLSHFSPVLLSALPGWPRQDGCCFPEMGKYIILLLIFHTIKFRNRTSRFSQNTTLVPNGSFFKFAELSLSTLENNLHLLLALI